MSSTSKSTLTLKSNMSLSKSTSKRSNPAVRRPGLVAATRLGSRRRENSSQPPRASLCVIYPWDRLTLEAAATESILGLPASTEAKLPRAIWWAVMQLHGDDGGEAFNALFPCLSRPAQKLEWVAMSGVAPISTDETTIGRIVSLVMAARNLLIEGTSRRAHAAPQGVDRSRNRNARIVGERDRGRSPRRRRLALDRTRRKPGAV